MAAVCNCFALEKQGYEGFSYTLKPAEVQTVDENTNNGGKKYE
ncbi:hypothetical protein [Pontibacter chinhatensis]|nr:hypothetical protein [Pontibacter chinhatensis]